MALEKKKVGEIPQDAVVLSKEQALKYHYAILNNWKSESDIFAYKYGSVFLGVSTMLVGGYINNHFRRKLKLFSYGRISSYLPICAAPATMCFFLHHEVVLKDLVLLQQNHCPICMEMKASAFQSLFGLALPLALAPITSLGLAQRYGTSSIPSILQEPLEVFKLVRKFVNPIKNVLFGIFVGQALLGSAVTYFEAKSIYKVHSQLMELENNLEYTEKM
ncbi:uncharacterized protein LOC108916823 [Anoplophora glabripennis]|uniref:uncharacterized protein LOC108916823 n=1 Tax=Anoplophora glabripennis TaxID=217634 RepID=UPI00087395A9|nr:uncharacterized protein LOC108916823 [Anoplophora glabripennis]XP_018578644.1 uncharacterized protein LOC108916823 [Anoplophora glabripennis]